MKYLLSFDDESGILELASGDGWCEPGPYLRKDIATAAATRPVAWWIDYGVIALAVGAIIALGIGGSW